MIGVIERYPYVGMHFKHDLHMPMPMGMPWGETGMHLKLSPYI